MTGGLEAKVYEGGKQSFGFCPDLSNMPYNHHSCFLFHLPTIPAPSPGSRHFQPLHHTSTSHAIPVHFLRNMLISTPLSQGQISPKDNANSSPSPAPSSPLPISSSSTKPRPP